MKKWKRIFVRCKKNITTLYLQKEHGNNLAKLLNVLIKFRGSFPRALTFKRNEGGATLLNTNAFSIWADTYLGLGTRLK